MNYCAVAGEDLSQLATVIVNAFVPDELEHLVRVTFGEGLYQSYVGRDLADDVLVFKLLTALERRGTTVVFLRAVRRARPFKQELIGLINQVCPPAMKDEPSAKAPIGTVISALQTLRERVSEPDVAGPLRSSRVKLNALADGFERLKAYKTLHDGLQTIQVPLYTIDLNKARDDPSILFMLQNQALQFDMVTGNICKGALALPDTALARRMEMKMVVEPLTQAVSQLQEAISDLDYPTAAFALNSIRGLMRREPSRINGQLTALAEDLPINLLIEAIEEIIRKLDQHDRTMAELKNALQGLHELLPRLRGQVAEHDIWQNIENELAAADQYIDRASLDIIQDFELHWKAVKLRIVPLWLSAPQASWVIKSQKFMNEFEMMIPRLATACADTDQLRRSYGFFRREALAQFYRVDSALNALCGEIVQMGKPLNALLMEIPDAG